MQWYYTMQGQRQGPVDDAGLEELVRQGAIQDDTYVWREGLAEWQLYSTVKPALISQPVQVPAPALSPRAADRPPAEAAELGASTPAQPESAPVRAAPSYTAPPHTAPPHTVPPGAVKPKAAGSDSYFFYYRVLRALGDGRVIRACVVWGLKIGAVAMVVGGFVSAAGILFGSQGSGARGMLSAVVLAVLLLGTSLCVGQVCWYRAGSVAALTESDYTVIPIASILFRAAGECAATAFAGIGVGMCLFLWLSPEELTTMALRTLPIAVPAATGFVGGIIALLYSGLLAFVALISGYLTAEWIAVLVDIAESIHRIRRATEKAQ